MARTSSWRSTGRRSVRAVKPSEVQAFLSELGGRYSQSEVAITRHVLRDTIALAVADGQLRTNPVESRIVPRSKRVVRPVTTTWSDTAVWGLVDAHPDSLRALPHTLATTGIREGEAFAISEDEIDEDRGLLHVRRQIKSAGRGRGWCYGLPKNDRERDVPLSRSTAEVLRAHIASIPVRAGHPPLGGGGRPATHPPAGVPAPGDR